MERTCAQRQAASAQRQAARWMTPMATAKELERVSDMLDTLTDQVRAAHRAVRRMQQSLQQPGVDFRPAEKLQDAVMSKAEVCAAFNIPFSATSTLKRKVDALLLPVGSHIAGAREVTWWKSDIEELLELMRNNSPRTAIQQAVAAMNARNLGGQRAQPEAANDSDRED